MTKHTRSPRLVWISEEAVLIQAWKKASRYIRYHNSFADTLALDHVTANLPEFITNIQERIKSSNQWKNDPLRIVPAPKSQDWQVTSDRWERIPKDKSERSTKKKTDIHLRPLAHLSLEDQVIATAIMLYIADWVESKMGDPREEINKRKKRKKVVAYGNRLFCDKRDGGLSHRWGSTKLYRSYFQDYRKFLSRPKKVAELYSNKKKKRDIYIIEADLSKFYDRVTPDLLSESLKKIKYVNDDPDFYAFIQSIFDWQWDPRDHEFVKVYQENAGINDFSRVALPQGLVVSGFMANFVLLDFDDTLKSKIGKKICDDIRLLDVCRYVDDLRVVVSVASKHSHNYSSRIVSDKVLLWLNDQLEKTASGLKFGQDKTEIIKYTRTDSQLLPQSEKMRRIQSAVSGGFDAEGGMEILDAIQGMLRTENEVSLGNNNDLVIKPDVRRETVARFAAGRFRRTFRSLRLILPAHDHQEYQSTFPQISTEIQLDQEAKRFAYDLIQRWINNPSNVRLLRIGLDLWPDVKVLQYILSILKPFTISPEIDEESKRVGWYCLSEILRAGATETGLVKNQEMLPLGTSIKSYREELYHEALRLSCLPEESIPWYLRQQALLFLIIYSKDQINLPSHIQDIREFHFYGEIIQFLNGEELDVSDSGFAQLAMVTRRSFRNQDETLKLIAKHLTVSRLYEITIRDLTLALELIKSPKVSLSGSDLPVEIQRDMCLISKDSEDETLAKVVMDHHPHGKLRNEYSLLTFAKAFLEAWSDLDGPHPHVITPEDVIIKFNTSTNTNMDEAEVSKVIIMSNESKLINFRSIYHTHDWCKPDFHWKFQLGFLLRFILSGQPDFTLNVYSNPWKENDRIYRPLPSHWYSRLYGFYCGHSAFGDDWLPISDWCEIFLFGLLRWPGCPRPNDFRWIFEGIESTIEKIGDRIGEIKTHYGTSSHTLILPMKPAHPYNEEWRSMLRACIVQTTCPEDYEFQYYKPALNTHEELRRKHRYHLSSVLATVDRLLKLNRKSKNPHHIPSVDWLILPELSVHPEDIYSFLIPFARAHKSIILAGLIYDEISVDYPLVNSLVWIIPEFRQQYGLQIRIRRQIKKSLNYLDKEINLKKGNLIRGFRPCQWVVRYPHCGDLSQNPFWLAASQCNDATDLNLIADLKDQSDIFAIPTRQENVNRLNQMASALSYQMDQMVIVANNGQHGGSVAWGLNADHQLEKKFQTLTEKQVTITFYEIPSVSKYKEEKESVKDSDPSESDDDLLSQEAGIQNKPSD